MLGGITIKGFKSVVDQTVSLGRVNVFVGPNGAGKSVVLEAVGVLGAAADGRVDDASLLRRGVRPGVPALYKNAFTSDDIPRFITLHAHSADAELAVYDLSLDNPLEQGGTPWRFSHEKVELVTGRAKRKFVTRGPGGATLWGAKGRKQSFKPKDATRSVVDVPNPLGEPPEQVSAFLARLRAYAIYDPQTPVLRGVMAEAAPLDPLGIHGGGLPGGMEFFLTKLIDDPSVKKRLFEMLGWASGIGYSRYEPALVPPVVPPSSSIVTFKDRFMRAGRNRLSAFDASEGALYVVFALALLFNPFCPPTFALENVGQVLHPRLARALVSFLADHAVSAKKQLLLTTHNPLVLDALDLRDEGVRLFTVDRDKNGHTLIRRITFSAAMKTATESGLTLSQMWTRGLIGGVPNIL